MLIRYIKGELLKIIYNKWLLIAIAATMVFIPVMVMTLGSYFGETGVDLLRSKLIQGFYLGQAGFIVQAGLYFGREYLRSSLRTTLLNTPVRYMLLASKFISVTVITAMTFLLSSLISIVLLILENKTGLGVNDVIKMVSVLIPCLISTVELVLFTASAVLISRSMIGSMAVPVSLLLGLGNMLLQYGKAFRFLPSVSTMNCFFIIEAPNYLSINSGLLVQGIWCLIALTLGWILFSRRTVR